MLGTHRWHSFHDGDTRMVFRYYHFMLEIWNGINLYSFAGDAWMVFIPRWRQMCRYAQPHTHTHQHTRTHTNTHTHACTLSKGMMVTRRYAQALTRTNTHQHTHAHACTLSKGMMVTRRYAQALTRTNTHQHTHAHACTLSKGMMVT